MKKYTGLLMLVSLSLLCFGCNSALKNPVLTDIANPAHGSSYVTSVEGERMVVNGEARLRDISPDGRYIAFVDSRWHGQLLDLKTGRQIPIKTHGKATFPPLTKAMAFSPDGRFLAVCAGGTAVIFDVRRGNVIRKVESTREFFDLDFSSDSKYLGVQTYSTIKVVDIETGSVKFEQTHMDGIRSVGFLPEASHLGFVEGSRSVTTDDVYKVYDFSTGKLVKEYVAEGHRIGVLKVSPDNKSLAFRLIDRGDNAAQNVAVLEIETLSTIASLTPQPIRTFPAVTDDFSLIALCNDAHEIIVYDISSGAVLCKLKGQAWPRALAFSSDNRILAIGLQSLGMASQSGAIVFYDLVEKRIVYSALTQGGIYDIVFGPEENVAIVSASDGIRFVSIASFE